MFAFLRKIKDNKKIRKERIKNPSVILRLM